MFTMGMLYLVNSWLSTCNLKIHFFPLCLLLHSQIRCNDSVKCMCILSRSNILKSPLSKFNISSSFTVQNLRTRLVKIDHVCFGYLATTSRLSVLLSITHKKRALYKISTSEHQNKCIYKWKKLAS